MIRFRSPIRPSLLAAALLCTAVGACGGSSEIPGTGPSSSSPPVIASFGASPPAVTTGQSSALTWSVSGATSLSIDPGVGTVTGSSTSVSPATTTIYTLTAANAAGRATSTTTVTVSPGAPAPVATVGVVLELPSIVVGQLTRATASLRDPGGILLSGRQVSWQTSDLTVAAVDASGLVLGTGAGTATVTATSEGMSGRADIVVSLPPVAPIPVSTVAVSLAESTVRVGQTTQASAVTRDADGNFLAGRTIAWSTSDAAVATVSASGVVTAVRPGTARIVATSEGKSGSASVSVSTATQIIGVVLADPVPHDAVPPDVAGCTPPYPEPDHAWANAAFPGLCVPENLAIGFPTVCPVMCFPPRTGPAFAPFFLGDLGGSYPTASGGTYAYAPPADGRYVLADAPFLPVPGSASSDPWFFTKVRVTFNTLLTGSSVQPDPAVCVAAAGLEVFVGPSTSPGPGTERTSDFDVCYEPGSVVSYWGASITFAPRSGSLLPATRYSLVGSVLDPRGFPVPVDVAVSTASVGDLGPVGVVQDVAWPSECVAGIGTGSLAIGAALPVTAPSAYTERHARGCVPYPISTVWQVLQVPSGVDVAFWPEGALAECQAQVIADPVYPVAFVTREIPRGSPIVQANWFDVTWRAGVSSGTPAAPAEVRMRYSKTGGTAQIPWLEGSVVISADPSHPGWTRLEVIRQFNGNGWSDEPLRLQNWLQDFFDGLQTRLSTGALTPQYCPLP